MCCLSACWPAASSPSRTGSPRPPSNSVCVTCVCVCCLSACWHAASSPSRTGSPRPPSNSVRVTCVCRLSVSLLARRLVPVADREPTSAFQLCLCDVCCVVCQPAGAPSRPRRGQGADVRLPTLSALPQPVRLPPVGEKVGTAPTHSPLSALVSEQSSIIIDGLFETSFNQALDCPLITIDH